MPFRGGIAQFLHNMVKSLSVDNEVVVFNFKKQYPTLLFPGKKQTEPAKYNQNFNNIRILTPHNPFTWKKTAKTVISYKIDLIVFKFWLPYFCLPYTYLINYLKKHTKIRISILCHNIEFHEKWLFSTFFTKKMLKNVDYVMVLSDNVYIQAKNYVPAEKIIKLFHPIYEVEPYKLSKKEAFEHLNIPCKISLLFLGFIKPYKGLDVLIKSIPSVIKNFKTLTPLAPEFEKDSNIQFIIAGEAYTRISIDEDENIIFRNKYISLDEIPYYMAIADAVLIPYRTASQSGIVQLAYSYLKPVIASDIPGLRENIIPEKTGILFTNEDENDLAEKILYFFKVKNSIDFENNIKCYNKDYSWEKFAKMFISHIN